MPIVAMLNAVMMSAVAPKNRIVKWQMGSRKLTLCALDETCDDWLFAKYFFDHNETS
jgi:hypothetical protein